MANPNLKPHVADGIMNMLDFVRLLQSNGFHTQQDPNLKAARDRVLKYTLCASPSEQMPDEVLHFICFEAVIIHRLWLFICCTAPDALFRLQAGRTRAIARAQIRTANFTRKIMLQINSIYPRFFYQFENERNPEYIEAPLICDIQKEFTNILRGAPTVMDREYYETLQSCYLMRSNTAGVPNIGLALVGNNFRQDTSDCFGVLSNPINEGRVYGHSTGSREKKDQETVPHLNYAYIYDQALCLSIDYAKVGNKEGAE